MKGKSFMISKELKKLSRRELVDVIYQLKNNEQQMQEQIANLEKELQEKRIRISEAGSIAAAAVDISDVLSAAQEAADLYLHEIACMKEEAERKVETILSEGKKKYEDLAARYRNDYKKWKQLQAEIKKLEEEKTWIEKVNEL